MSNINVAVIGEEAYARNLGRKGTVSDITFYDFKSPANHTITAIEPSKYPEKMASLFYALSITDFAVIVVNNIDAVLGEMILTADTLGIKTGAFVMKNYHQPEEMAPLIKGTSLEGFEFMADDPIKLKDQLLYMAANKKTHETPKGAVPIDHLFNVKGVGTVILGVVASGTIRRHDELKVLPTANLAQVRSIQKHDDDFEVATIGDRVGLALKNITVEELDRGYVLTNEDMLCLTKLNVKVTPHKFWKKPLEVGMVLQIGHWMQYMPARVEKAERTSEGYALELLLEHPMALKPDSRLFVSHIDTPKLRVIGPAYLS